MKLTSIKFRLNVWFVQIISVLLLAFGALNYVRTKTALQDSMVHQVDASLGRLGNSLPNSLWN